MVFALICPLLKKPLISLPKTLEVIQGKYFTGIWVGGRANTKKPRTNEQNKKKTHKDTPSGLGSLISFYKLKPHL